jgi:hypothetical protein
MIPVYWDEIKYGVRQCSEEQRRLSDEQLNNLLLSLLSLDAQLWLAYEEETPESPYGFVITYMSTRDIDKRKQLWIYALYSFKYVPDSIWAEGFRGLNFFAEKNECSEIIAYTNNPRIKEVASEFMPVRYTVISKFV